MGLYNVCSLGEVGLIAKIRKIAGGFFRVKGNGHSF